MTNAGNPSKGHMSEDELRVACAERDRARDPERGHFLIDHLLQNFGGDYIAGLEAVLLGSLDTLQVTPKGKEPPFWSVKARQLDLLSMFLRGLITELEKHGLTAVWTSGGAGFDREVARALWQIGGAPGSEAVPGSEAGFAEHAVTTAKIIHRFLELARNAQNMEGGYQPSYPGALLSGGHDGLKLRRAGKAAWIAFVRPLLHPATFERFDEDDLLDLAWETYDLYQDHDIQLRFRDADAWCAYNERFGLGTLRDAVVAAMERSTRRAGLRAVFGSKPEHILKGIVHSLAVGTKTAISDDNRSWLLAALATLAPAWPLGMVDPYAERDLSDAAREELINLAEAFFRDLADLPALDTKEPYQSTTLLAAIDAELAAFVSATWTTTAAARVDFARAIAVFCESFTAALAQRFVASDLGPGKSVELLRQFLKLNVTYWWSELQRRAARAALGAHLRHSLTRGFEEIDPDMAATLAEYGMDSARWEAIRQPARHEASQQTPASETPRDMIESWMWDRLILVAIPGEEPIHERLTRGAADFTAESELLRFMAQFRVPRAPFVPRPHGTVALTEADLAVKQALKSGDSLPALTSTLLWMVLFTRLDQLGSNLSEGRPPLQGRDESAWLNVAQASGALGLVADLLFGETTGLRVAPLGAFATVDHPSIESALDIWRSARNGEDARGALAIWAKKEGDRNSLDKLQTTRQAMNAALLHQLREMMSPGYLQRNATEARETAASAYWRTPDGRDQ